MWQPKTGTAAYEDFYLGFREVEVAAGWNVYKTLAAGVSVMPVANAASSTNFFSSSTPCSAKFSSQTVDFGAFLSGEPEPTVVVLGGTFLELSLSSILAASILFTF